MGSRLFDEIREQRGLAYSVSAVPARLRRRAGPAALGRPGVRASASRHTAGCGRSSPSCATTGRPRPRSSARGRSPPAPGRSPLRTPAPWRDTPPSRRSSTAATSRSRPTIDPARRGHLRRGARGRGRGLRRAVGRVRRAAHRGGVGERPETLDRRGVGARRRGGGDHARRPRIPEPHERQRRQPASRLTGARRPAQPAGRGRRRSRRPASRSPEGRARHRHAERGPAHSTGACARRQLDAGRRQRGVLVYDLDAGRRCSPPGQGQAPAGVGREAVHDRRADARCSAPAPGCTPTVLGTGSLGATASGTATCTCAAAAIRPSATPASTASGSAGTARPLNQLVAQLAAAGNPPRHRPCVRRRVTVRQPAGRSAHQLRGRHARTSAAS